MWRLSASSLLFFLLAACASPSAECDRCDVEPLTTASIPPAQDPVTAPRTPAAREEPAAREALLPPPAEDEPQPLAEDEPTADAATETPLAPQPEVTRPDVCGVDTPDELPLAAEGAFVAQGALVAGQREACTSALHATAGARESVLRVTLDTWDSPQPARLSVRDLDGHVLGGPTVVAAGESVQVALNRSGEVLLHLAPVDPESPAHGYALAVDCLQGCDDEYTRHPVVLLHGLGGAETFGEMNYYFQVREVLEPLGYALHSPEVSPFSTPEARALEWEAHLDALVAEGAGRRFNLIAHSQAGLDARYLVSGLDRPDLVASVVTIGTPHHGTYLGDLFHGLVEDETVDGDWVDLGAAAFAELFGLGGYDDSLVDAMGSMTEAAMADFNTQHLDHEDVYYASWAGVSCGALEFSCQAKCGGEIVDPALATTYFILWLKGAPNDGMVPLESAMWGDYRGQICADHADEVGLFGDKANDAFDHLDFYLDELRRLAALEL